MPVALDEHGNDYTPAIEARVTDASSREVSGKAVVHATYGDFLVAVERRRLRARARAARVTLTVRAVDYAGNAAGEPARSTIAVGRRQPNASWDAQRACSVVQQAEVTTDADGRADVDVHDAERAGRLPDARQRRRQRTDGRATTASSGCRARLQSTTEDYGGDRYLELIADRKTVNAGETRALPGPRRRVRRRVLVTKEAQDVSWYRVVRVRGNETFEVPIADDDVGDTWVNIAFLTNDRLYRAERRVKVPATSRQLQVSLTAEQAVAKPRQPGRFLLKAVDDNGAPVRAQFSLAVIDEAVYGVKADDTPDPLRFFYRRKYSRVGTQFSRDYSFVGYSGTAQLMLAARRRAYSLADFKGDKPAQPQVRKEFPDAIYWVGRPRHRRERRSARPGDVSRRADHVAPDRARRDRRHARRQAIGAHHRHEGSDRRA